MNCSYPFLEIRASTEVQEPSTVSSKRVNDPILGFTIRPWSEDVGRERGGEDIYQFL